MAITSVANVLIPGKFAEYALEQSLVSSALIKSGIVAVNPVLSAFLAGAGSTINLPSFRHLTEDGTEANVASFDPADRATPGSLVSRQQVGVKLVRNRSYSTATLAGMLAGADPMQAVAAYFGEQLASDRQKIVLATITGVVGADASLTNDSGAAFSLGGLLETRGVWGDRATGNVALVMNSKQFIQRQIAEATAFVPASMTQIGLATYLGMPVIVDDKIADGEIVLIEMGAIAQGAAMHARPVAVEFDEAAANGDGVETITFRDVFMAHVDGSAYVGDVTAGLPSNAALATAANWNIVKPAKAVGVLKYKFI
jgi:hypothetical protein